MQKATNHSKTLQSGDGGMKLMTTVVIETNLKTSRTDYIRIAAGSKNASRCGTFIIRVDAL